MMNALMPLNLDEVFGSFLRPSRSCAPSSGGTARYLPPAEILEGEKDYLIRLEMPGVGREDLNLEVEDQTLIIKAEREWSAPEGYHSRRQERPSKLAFQRSFNLGQEIEQDSIDAKLEHGVLTITLPKTEKALPRRIEVK